MSENKFVSLPSHLKTIEPMEVHRGSRTMCNTETSKVISRTVIPWCQSVEVTREAVALQFGDNVHLRVKGDRGKVAVGVVVIAECHALIVGKAVKVWSHRALQSYHFTLSLAVDVVAAYLSAGGHGGFALAVLGLDLCHTEDLQTNRA